MLMMFPCTLLSEDMNNSELLTFEVDTSQRQLDFSRIGNKRFNCLFMTQSKTNFSNSTIPSYPKAQ